MADINSIASELDERLSSLFGEDVNDKEGFDSTGSSPLTELQVLMLTIDWEINDDSLIAFNKELDGLKQLFMGDPYVPLLLKMLSSLIGYLKNKKAQAHPNTLNVLRSVFATLEKVVEATDLSTQKKKSLVDGEIEGFKKLKNDITGTSAPTTPSMLHDKPGRLPDQKPEPGDGGIPVFAVEGETVKSVRTELSPEKNADQGDLAFQVIEGNASIRNELSLLKGEIQGLWRELNEIQGNLSQTRAIVEDIRGALQQIPAVTTMLAEIQSQIMTISKSKISLSPSHQDPITPEDFWDDPDTIKGMPLNLEVGTQVPTVEEKSEQGSEVASSFESNVENQIQEERTIPYIFFELGEKRYAVDESTVMKSCKVSRGRLKKARGKGEITLNDFRVPFTSIKRGLEATWKNASAKDLKKQKFALVDGDQLEGLSSTKGGGILFLASEDKRLALVTDHLPQKEFVSESNVSIPEIGKPCISGYISKDRELPEPRLIVDVDTLLSE